MGRGFANTQFSVPQSNQRHLIPTDEVLHMHQRTAAAVPAQVVHRVRAANLHPAQIQLRGQLRRLRRPIKGVQLTAALFRPGKFVGVVVIEELHPGLPAFLRDNGKEGQRLLIFAAAVPPVSAQIGDRCVLTADFPVCLHRPLQVPGKLVVGNMGADGFQPPAVQNRTDLLGAFPVQSRQLDAAVPHPGQLTHSGVKVCGSLLPYGI